MRPIYVEMTGFGSYLDTTRVDFSAVKGGKYIICGDTGAGKTMIFDGIMYSLFGECSGSDRDIRKIRNKNLNDEDNTIVTLKFMHKGKEYIVTRKFHYNGVDSNGKKKEYKTVTITDADGKKLSSSNDYIPDLIGLDKNQFKQIVMLAQNEFKLFLKSDPLKKAEILGKIVEGKKYERYQELLKIAADSINSKRQDSLDTIETLMADVFIMPEESSGFTADKKLPGNPNLTEDLNALILLEEDEKKILSEQERIQTEKHAELNKNRGAAGEHNKLLADLKEKNTHLAYLQRSAEEYAVKKKDLDIVNKGFHKVIPAYRNVLEKQNALKELKELIEKNQTEIGSLENAKTEAEKKLKEDEPKKAEIEKLTSEITSLEESLPRYAELEKKNADLQKRTEGIEADKKSLVLKENELTILQTSLLCDQAAVEKMSGAETKAATLNAELTKIKSDLEQITKNDGIFPTVKSVLSDEIGLKENIEKLEFHVKKTAELKAIFDAKYQKFITGQAGILAEETKRILEAKGEGLCPVCGTHLVKGEEIHFAETEEDVPTKEEVEKTKENWEKQDAVRESCDGIVKKTKTEIATRKEALLNAASTVFSENLSWEILSSEEYLNGKTNALKKSISEKENEILILQNQKKEFDNLQKKIGESREKITTLTAETGSLKTAVSTGEQELAKRKKETEEYRKSLQFENETLVKGQIQNRKDRKASMEQIIRTNTDAYRDVSEKYNKLSGELKANKEKLPVAEKSIEEANVSLELMLKETGLESAEKTKADMLAIFEKYNWKIETSKDTESWIDKTGKEITDYENDCINTKKRVEELKKSTEGLKEVDLSELDLTIAKEKAKLDAITDKYHSKAQLIKNHREVLERIKQEKEKLLNSDYAAEMLNNLSVLANPGSGKADFNRYVLGGIFKEVLERTNDRLVTMFPEYRLVYKAEASDGRNRSGLDFEVLENDKIMDRDSLSGGESFVVALALAIGLSDYVQSVAGGIRIETLFIDEGFGTLDDNLLEKTLNAIDTLSGNGERCLVGMISHVDKLEGRIEEKFHVVKGPNGSTVRPEGMEYA